MKKIKAYGISYISVNGISMEENKPIYPYVIELQVINFILRDNALLLVERKLS